MSEELKPCPFCGGEAETQCTAPPHSDWFVLCKNCGASAPIFNDVKLDGWNLRAAPAAQAVDEPDATELAASLVLVRRHEPKAHGQAPEFELDVPNGLRWYVTASTERLARAIVAQEVRRKARAALAAPVQSQAVAEVIATGGPHDSEDRVLSELQSELPPIGTKLYAAPVRAVRMPHDQSQQLAKLCGLLELAVDVLKNVDDLDYTGEGVVSDIERELNNMAERRKEV